jgi:hypothetical protein
MMPVKTLSDRVKWTGPYIAVDNTKGTEGEHKGLVLEPAPGGFCFMVGNGATIAGVDIRVHQHPQLSFSWQPRCRAGVHQ